MNVANKLTLFRVILIPIFIFFMSIPTIPHWALISLIIFSVAAYTDHLDGAYARKYNLITNFGIFMDPFADKLLVTSAMIMLVALGMIPAWIAIVIIAREFAVSGLRTVTAKDGLVIAASNLGKIKTTLQMSAIILMLIKLILTTDTIFADVWSWIGANASFLINLPDILMILAALMTLYSGYDYFRQGWKYIDPTE